MNILNLIAQKIYDKKGFNIIAIDVRGISTLTDYMIIAEGNVERHVQALSRSIIEALDESDYPHFHLDGLKDGDWIAIDCGEIFIHLLVPELREKYALEELWRKGKIVDLKVKTEPNTKKES